MQSRIYSLEEAHVESLIAIPENPPAIAVSVKGWVTTSGWTHADLAPWMYVKPPADGMLDLDFVATPPNGLVLQILSKIAVAKSFPVPAWVQGVRIHSSTDRLEARLSGAPKPSAAVLMGEGLPLPWPFPWWAPNSR